MEEAVLVIKQVDNLIVEQEFKMALEASATFQIII